MDQGDGLLWRDELLGMAAPLLARLQTWVLMSNPRPLKRAPNVSKTVTKTTCPTSWSQNLQFHGLLS